MEQFLTHFPSVFSQGNLAVLILGSVGGLFFGAMPGLSPTMVVALLVPFTFYLPADTSLILLGAVYTSAVVGGSISAILLSISGAPSSIATLFDGYSTAKQGRAQEALYIVFVSSPISDVFDVLVMILFSPPMVEPAIRFGPSELFWTAIFGITVITGLFSGAMLKGLFSGAFGMLLSTVGYNTLTGESRFVIRKALNDGIALVPALIGLLAIPQIIDLMTDSRVPLEKLTFKPQKGMLRQVIEAHRRYLRTLGIGSLIGTVIGVIPGAGGQVAGPMSYDQTKKFDKNPGRFGTGDPEGVCAVESANDATVVPAMIPLLALSVPGSPTAAVLLGGLFIHDLFPSPGLFMEKADVTYTFISDLLLAQFFMCFFGLLASRYSHLVAIAPNYIMFAAVMILCMFGSYYVQNSCEDVILVFTPGVLMFVLAKFGFLSAPIVLGVILGPIAEENFLRGKMIVDADVGIFSYFFTGGLNLALIALCLLSLIQDIYSEVKYTRNHFRKAAAANQQESPTLYKEFISALVMTGIITAFVIPMTQLSGESQVVPLLLLICMGIFNMGQYILAGLRYAAKVDVKVTTKGYPLRRVTVLFVLTILYLLFLETLGFHIGALLYFIAASLIAQPMKITLKLAVKRIAVCFVCIAFLHCLFTVLLAVRAPKGILGI